MGMLYNAMTRIIERVKIRMKISWFMTELPYFLSPGIHMLIYWCKTAALRNELDLFYNTLQWCRTKHGEQQNWHYFMFILNL